ncbi:uncharacterized protein LOC119999725 [Tripterygium wilfordii]|uniref:uncharacterized protein LOC119999725 n=1 Tax=Tripterygium wilfordii TaxID=458696 RepID=UPI0018F8220C|nr:uncharacterized protein LOC119999725 [Tripterygium wilfordii]
MRRSTLAIMINNMKKSPRIADESALDLHHHHRDNMNNDVRSRERLLWVLSSIVRAPFSCFSSQHHVSDADRVWASGEYVEISEINHIMVSDSMRYAVLM